MLKIISYLTMTIALLSGCSELQVISNAAMRELRADGMSVEAISYSYNQKLAARGNATTVMMAKTAIPGTDVNVRMAGYDNKLKQLKQKKSGGFGRWHRPGWIQNSATNLVNRCCYGGSKQFEGTGRETVQAVIA